MDKPWVYWWWIKGNVTHQSITRDLVQMKAKGIGGFLLFDARGYGEEHLPPPPAPMEFLSPEWRRLVKFAMSEAHRLGLQVSMNLSTHGGSLRAPWETGANAPKKLIWTSSETRGPRRLNCELRRPNQAHFWDVALVAVRHSGEGAAAAAGTDTVNLSENWRDIVFDPRQSGRSVAEVVDLTDKVDARGHLEWEAPAGIWTLLRFGAVTMAGHETDVDILNEKAVEEHFNRMGKAFLEDAGPLAGQTLTYFYNVSWEGASPTWTPGFDKEFLKYRGYDFRPYLPVLTGMAVKTQEVSSRFLEDYSRTLGDCFMNNCYRKVSELCQQYGIKWHSESGGPWDREKPLFLDSDQLAFWGRNDMPQGEFWHQRWQTLKDGTKVWLSNVRRTAMAAHIYGRPLVAAEAFTNMNPHWQEYPAVLKPEADDAFVDGVNQFVWHTFGASPVEFGKPGLVYFAGTHLNPNVTWWEDAGAFLTYLGRAQFLLRQGRFVSDACVYSSDRNYLTWGRDKKWSDKASLSLPKGYTYDLINTEVLVDRLSVENGSLVLPDGMRYRTLVLDLEENVMPPEALAKIVALARGGATVVLGQRRPGRELGLKGYPARDAEVQRLAGELWGTSNAQGARPFGKGKVIRDMRLEEALKLQAIVPDFAGPFEYIHRHSRDADIYFLAGTGRADCTFRIDGKEPELWDAVTGRIRDAIEWRATGDGRTVVPLSLPGNGSIFVVFRKPASNRHLIAISHPDGVEIEGRTPEGARLRLWRPGPCALESADKSQVNVAASNLPEPLTLTGAWEVRFSPGWGAPASTVFEQLTPWNEDSRTAIKHFSGTATYRKAFELDEARAKRPLRLQLGEVKDIAQVRVNGKSLGVVWTDPWTVDLTGVIRPGKNQLEVDVTNTWVNRLIGDAALPEQERLTRTMVRRSPSYQGRYPYLRGYLATDSLLRSGLLGPVRLEFGEERDVRF